MNTVAIVLVLIGSYLLGGVPWGLVLGEFRGIDVRKHGSGSTGATNTLRVLGWQFSLAVFLLDFGKGLLPVVIARLAGWNPWIVGAVAILPVIGHCWSPYIGFKGGKGMATSGGAAVGLLPVLLVILPLMILVVYLTRYVSLASIIAAVVGPLVGVIFAIAGDYRWEWVVALAVMGGIIIYKHRPNIRRLLDGTENKFGARAKVS